MAAVAASLPATRPPARHLGRWWPVYAGLCAVLLPTYLTLARGPWQGDANAHGPVVLGVAVWALWQLRARLAAAPDAPAPALGGALLAAGALAWVLGRSQDVLVLEVGAQIPVLAGVLLVTRGRAAARVVLFPLLYLAFLVPLPGPVVDALTGPLKHFVSVAAAAVLDLAGYGVARSGVVLTVGPYQLLVADACAGLHSLYALSAVGLVLVWMWPAPGRWRNAVLVAAILPMAVLANVVRVVALALITVHFGDAAGQGFMHNFAGLAMFAVAVVGLMALRAALAGTHRPPVPA